MNPSEDKKLVIIGKCGRAYGVRGWMHIQSFTAQPQNILNYLNWVLISPSGEQQSVHLDGLKPHGDHFVAKIKGIDSPEAVRPFCLSEIAIHQSDLPELDDGQYYWAELKGLTAVLPTGKKLGTVKEIFATGANDVITVVTEQQKEILVPYLDDVVLAIDLDQGTMTLDWDPAERYEDSHEQ